MKKNASIRLIRNGSVQSILPIHFKRAVTYEIQLDVQINSIVYADNLGFRYY